MLCVHPGSGQYVEQYLRCPACMHICILECVGAGSQVPLCPRHALVSQLQTRLEGEEHKTEPGSAMPMGTG